MRGLSAGMPQQVGGRFWREARSCALAAILLYAAIAYLTAGLSPLAAVSELLISAFAPSDAPADLFSARRPVHAGLPLIFALSVGLAVGGRAALRHLRLRRPCKQAPARPAPPIHGTGARSEIYSRLGDVMLMLEKRDRSRRELLAGLSHDLLKPVGSIRGYLETLLLQRDNLSPEKIEQYLRAAVKNTETLDGMLSECLELSKLECPENKPEIEPFMVQDLMSDVYAKFMEQAARGGISLEVYGEMQAPAALGDVGMIERALSNLVDNAVRYTPSGGRVQLSFFPRNDRIAMMVQDSGIGIPPQELPRIFEPLYRAKKEGFKDPGGNGLGLSITLKILEAHKTRLFVESVPGKGTAMGFDLPRA